MHSTLQHRHQRASRRPHTDEESDSWARHQDAVSGYLARHVASVFSLVDLRHHPVDRGTFTVNGDECIWRYQNLERRLPLDALGGLTFPWHSYDQYAEARKHADITGREEAEPSAPADTTDLDRRFQRIVDAFAADELEREIDGYGRPLNKWQCPTHDDEHPSLSVNPDLNTGRILAYCHSGGDDCGNKYAKGHPMYREHRAEWMRELARCLDIHVSTFFPSRKASGDYDAPF